MSETTGGELLAHALAAEGVEVVFGLPCPDIDPLLAAMDKTNAMRFVPIRHEAAGVHMAEGYYKTTGKVACVLGNPGPGSANLLPGLCTARHEGVPVFAITSQHRMEIVYPSPASTFQGQDQLDLFRPAVKWGGPITSWERIPEVVRLASREMWAGRPGPVQLEIPAPVMYATGNAGKLILNQSAHWRGPAPEASERQLEEAAAILAGARRPVVVAGAGVDRGNANAELLDLVALLGCPVVTSMAGRSTVRSDHPNFIMGFSPAGDLVRCEADVILVAGSRMGNLDLPLDKYWGDSSRQKLIQIDIDPRNLGLTRPLTLGMVADVKTTLAGLVARLKGRRMAARDPGDLPRYRQVMQDWFGRMFGDVANWRGPGIHPAHAMQVIGQQFGNDTVYTIDGGNTSLWASLFLPPTRSSSLHNILEFGMLGTGIPSAIGSKLSSPDRDVICVTGDGAAGFNIMELETAAREGVKITVVVCAEGAWTLEEPNELMRWGKTFGTRMSEVRWDHLAMALGCHGEYVDSLTDLGPALARAKAADKPGVVCLKTSLQANLAIPQEIMMRFFEVYVGSPE